MDNHKDIFIRLFTEIALALNQGVKGLLHTVKALAHYNWDWKKSSYRSYTLQLFSTTIFSTVLYMNNAFYKDFFRKIFVKIFVVRQGFKGMENTFEVSKQWIPLFMFIGQRYMHFWCIDGTFLLCWKYHYHQNIDRTVDLSIVLCWKF